MERLISSISRPTIKKIQYIPQLIVIQRGTHRAVPKSFSNEVPSNYIEEMYEQWSKDPHSVHKV